MSKTFVINEIVDATENNSFSLVDSDLNNKGTVLIKDGKITLYWENGDPEINFDEDYESLVEFVKDSDLNFIKLRNGNRRWVSYNPNPKSRNIGDCTLRAYCAAFGIDWDKAFDIASKIAKANSSMIQYMFPKIMEDHFGCEKDPDYNKKGRKAQTKDRITVNEFAMTHPYGTYVLGVRQHAVTVKNGEYWDSWDSGDKKVDTVYIVKNK
jgi:hypothetical protein